MNPSNYSFYTSKTAWWSDSTTSCEPYQNCLSIFSILSDTVGISLYYTFPTLKCIHHKMYVCIKVNKYLHFMIRGERKILKQMGHVKSDESVFPLLMNKENFSQHPFCFDASMSILLSFSFPILIEPKKCGSRNDFDIDI